LQKVKVLPFDKDVVKHAVLINRQLKQKRKQIDLTDLFIAATAVVHDILLATLNRKYFDRFEPINVIK